MGNAENVVQVNAELPTELHHLGTSHLHAPDEVLSMAAHGYTHDQQLAKYPQAS